MVFLELRRKTAQVKWKIPAASRREDGEKATTFKLDVE